MGVAWHCSDLELRARGFIPVVACAGSPPWRTELRERLPHGSEDLARLVAQQGGSPVAQGARCVQRVEYERARDDQLPALELGDVGEGLGSDVRAAQIGGDQLGLPVRPVWIGADPRVADHRDGRRNDHSRLDVARRQGEDAGNDRPEVTQGDPLGLEAVLGGEQRQTHAGGRVPSIGERDRPLRPGRDRAGGVLRLGREQEHIPVGEADIVVGRCEPRFDQLRTIGARVGDPTVARRLQLGTARDDRHRVARAMQFGGEGDADRPGADDHVPASQR